MFAKHKRTNTDSSARPVRHASFSSLPARTLILQSTANSGAATPSPLAGVPEKSALRTKDLTPLETAVEEPLFQDSFLTSPIFDMSSPEEGISPYSSPVDAFHSPKESFSPIMEMDPVEDDDDDELTLEELASRVTILDSDVATTVYIARAGRPKVIDVSPPASIRARPASIAVYNPSSTNSSMHSRSSSYFATNQLRRSRSSSMSSHGRSDSDSGTFSSSGISPASERTSREIIESVPEEVVQQVQFFPAPPRTPVHHRKQLSASVPKSLREKIEKRDLEDVDDRNGNPTSNRSSMSLDGSPAIERKASRFPNPLSRKAGGWFHRA